MYCIKAHKSLTAKFLVPVLAVQIIGQQKPPLFKVTAKYESPIFHLHDQLKTIVSTPSIIKNLSTKQSVTLIPFQIAVYTHVLFPSISQNAKKAPAARNHFVRAAGSLYSLASPSSFTSVHTFLHFHFIVVLPLYLFFDHSFSRNNVYAV